MRTTPAKFLAIGLAIFATSSIGAATVWKWVDKSGVTHYSDQPVPGAVQVDLLSVQTYDANEAAIPAADRSTSQSPDTSAAPIYRGITIVEPANEETLAGTGGEVSVSVEVKPEVQAGHSLQIMLDGKVVSPADSSVTSLVLKDVPRGEHTISASVVARNGRALIQSSAITFYMQQNSVLKNR